METKNYAVAVKRTAIDFILISATSEREAAERAELILNESEAEITVGSDGEDFTIMEATLSEPDGLYEYKQLQANNTAAADLIDNV